MDNKFEPLYVIVIKRIFKSLLIYLPIINFAVLDNIKNNFFTNNLKNPSVVPKLTNSFLWTLLFLFIYIAISSIIIMPIIHLVNNDLNLYIDIYLPVILTGVLTAFYFVPIVWIISNYKKVKNIDTKNELISINTNFLKLVNINKDDINSAEFFERFIPYKKSLCGFNSYSFIRWQFIYYFIPILKTDYSSELKKINITNIIVDLSWFTIYIVSLVLIFTLVDNIWLTFIPIISALILLQFKPMMLNLIITKHILTFN